MSTTTSLNVVLSLSDDVEITVPNTGILSGSNTGIFFGGFAILVVAAFVISRLIKHKNSTNFHIKKKKTLAVSLLAILALPALINVLNNLNLNQTNSASAIRAATLTDDLLEVTATSAGTLTLDAGILGTEELAYVKDTITVSEEVSGPYTIYLTASDNKLVHESNPNLVIPSITEAGELTDKSFGYTIGNPAEQQNVTWNPVTTEKTAIIKSDATLKDKTFDVYYAVRAKDVEAAGTYNLDLNYTLTIDFDGTMQGMSSAICERMELETPYTLKDARDNNEYNVVRLKDNNCYMQDDLQLILSTEKTLTSADTDLNSKDSWTPNFNTMYIDEDGRAYSDPEYHNELSMDSVLSEFCDGRSMQECMMSHIDLSAIASDGMYAYNGVAGLAHPSIPSTYIDINNIDAAGVTIAKDSICPKGWQLLGSDLPQNIGTAYGLYDLYDLGNEDEVAATFDRLTSLLNISVTDDSGLAYSLNEYYAGRDDNNRAVFVPNILTVNQMSFFRIIHFVNRASQQRVRCVTRRTGFAHLNIEGVGELSVELSGDGKSEFTVPSDAPTRDDYTFVGYSDTEDGAVKYQPGDIITTADRSMTLYTIWAKPVPGVTYMQDMDPDICASLNLGELYLLKDARDEKTYTISRIQYSGAKYAGCWMMDDLDFQPESGTTLYSDDTNVRDYWSPGDTEAAQTYSAKPGVRFYSRLLATAAGEGSICPRGWYIPDGEEYNNLYGENWRTNILRISLNGEYDPYDEKIRHAGTEGTRFASDGNAYYFGHDTVIYDGNDSYTSSPDYYQVRCLAYRK